MPPGLEYNIHDLFQEAKKRWLKPVEVLYILRNHEQCEFTHKPPQQPPGGSLFLFNRRVLRFFRKDGHNWRKKRDGRTVGEAHERLKVGNVEILNCYYAHGEENRTFQRRSYWILDQEYEHVVLVHYRETNEGKSNSEPVTRLSAESVSHNSQNYSLYSHNEGTMSMFGDSHELSHNFSSPMSLEVTSETQALRQLEEHLNLDNDSFKEISPFYTEHETALDAIPCQDQSVVHREDEYAALSGPNYKGRYEDCDNYYHDLLDDCIDGNKETISWTEVLELGKADKLPGQHAYENENSLSSSGSGSGMIANQENNHWLNPNSNNAENTVLSFPEDIGEVKFPPYLSRQTQRTNSDHYATLSGQIRIQEPLGVDSSLTVVQKQKFTIKAVSPEYCYATDTAKVVIIGSFLCPPLGSVWACMFGDVEVPAEIIQDGVICCKAPSGLLGKVTLCVTSGNREPCSEFREFEFRNKATSCTHCNSSETEPSRSPEELLLLVRFAEMLLSASNSKDGSIQSGSYLSTKQKDDDDDSCSHIMHAFLDGSSTSSGTVNWLLEEMLKDKLQLWLSSRSGEIDEGTGCCLSKKEQGIIHMVSGLGFEWALNPILSCGVNINFRDINGWTALHWAARFGREKTVASLIASDASAGAVTDPCSQDRTGKTAATIAASHGHKGLAAYLSEVDLTSHLSSLTLETNEIPIGSSELEAELTVNSVSKENLVAGEDAVSLKASLDAVRNSAQAAARIQAAFRAHSFRKQKEREAFAAAAGLDRYGVGVDNIDDNISLLSALSKLNPRSLCDYNLAALSIQKKYRGWKSRKEFLAFREKVVKIQACVRGYQVRKQYKVILWAVGILDKVVLRWRRKRVGLRIARQEMESREESDDEDFLKEFRKEKVHLAIEKALKWVLSMVHHTNARQQYRRLLEMYRQTKAAHDSTMDETPSTTSTEDALSIEDDDLNQIWEALCPS